MYQRALVLIRC